MTTAIVLADRGGSVAVAVASGVAVVDEGGVALAAIQGLNQKLTAELQRRDAENAELRYRLDRLEQLLSQSHSH